MRVCQFRHTDIRAPNGSRTHTICLEGRHATINIIGAINKQAIGLSPMGACKTYNCAPFMSSFLILLLITCFFIKNAFKKFSFWSPSAESNRSCPSDRALRYTKTTNSCHPQQKTVRAYRRGCTCGTYSMAFTHYLFHY